MKKAKRNYSKKRTVRKKKKIRKKLSLKFIMILLVACLGGAGIIFSPIFSVKTIEITEMEQYSNDDICDIIGLRTGANIFLYNKKRQ